MCNLSQGIVEDTKSEIIMTMHEKNYSAEQIAEIVKFDVETVRRIINENSPAYV
jgi:predicted transposase YdaD